AEHDDEQDQEEGVLHAYECLILIVSTMFATSSHRSSATSMSEWMSFHLMISMAFVSRANRSATASRKIWSPSFSNVWSLIQCGSRSFKPSRLFIMRTISLAAATSAFVCRAAPGRTDWTL